MFETAVLAVDLSRIGIVLSKCAVGLRELGVKRIVVAQCMRARKGMSIAYSYNDRKRNALLEQEWVT